MRNKQHIWSLPIALIVLFIVFIGLTNWLISSYVNDPVIFKERHEHIAAIPLELDKPLLQKPTDDLLTPEDPTEYNIQVFRDKALSISQAQWDINMKTALLYSPTTVYKEDGKKTPRELKERLSRINRQIKDLEKKRQEDPGDQTEEMRLQSLYILKSSLTVLDQTAETKTPKKK